MDEPRVPVKGGKRSPAGDVPEPQPSILAARDDLLAVRAKRQAADKSPCYPGSVRTSLPVLRSQSRIALSQPPEAIQRPSGLKVTA